MKISSFFLSTQILAASAHFWDGGESLGQSLSRRDISARNSVPRELYRRREIDAACNELANKYRSSVLLPGDANFTKVAEDHWSQQAVIIPVCIFQPSTDAMVADALQIISRRQVLFGVRSGGHMPVKNAASTAGVLISMSNFRDLSFNARSRCASVGPGRVWGEIYSWIDSLGYRVMGGRVYPVGTALILGGGLTYFSGQNGWAANNVRNFHVVLANGTVVDANKYQNSDLWWALKGGSNNFGIVTRYDLDATPKNDIFGGSVTFRPENFNDYIRAHAAFIAPGGGSEDPKAAIMPSLEVNCLTGALSSSTVMLYDAANPNPKALENFTSIPIANGWLGVQSFANLSLGTQSANTNRNLRQSFHTLDIKGTPESVFLANRTVVDTSLLYLSGRNVSIGVAMQPLTTNHMQAALDRGGDPISLDPANGPLNNVLVFARWDDEGLDEIMQFWAEQSLKLLRTRSANMGIASSFNFLNDAGYPQDPIMAYNGGKSRARLQAIARRYDPTSVFQTLTGGFSLYMV